MSFENSKISDSDSLLKLTDNVNQRIFDKYFINIL